MDESQSIIFLVFNCNWSISYGLRFKTSIVNSDLSACNHYSVFEYGQRDATNALKQFLIGKFLFSNWSTKSFKTFVVRL